MRIAFRIGSESVNKFVGSCEATIRNVGRATRTGTEQACKDILNDSLAQVPRNTGTLASTGFYEVTRRTDIKGYTYEGTIGYAGMTGKGAKHDAVNSRTGAAASTYAVVVHENLFAIHPVGKAKFLEDPVRSYGSVRFKRVAETHWKSALRQANSRSSRGGT